MSFPIFSQSTVLNDKGDTTICFSLPQAKFLLKQHYQVQMIDSLNSICETQLDLCDSINLSSLQAYEKYENLLLNKDEVINVKDYEINTLKTVVNNQKKEIKKQKIFKWLGIGGGTLLSGFFAYKYITK
jgi:hypothetical protein